MSFSSGSVRIELDAGQNTTFTSLDVVAGRIFFSIPSEETISSIQVKLEGISRTLLVVPKNENDRRKKKKDKDVTKNSIEVHRVLYQVSTVFPPKDIKQLNSSQKYTLKAGNYQYPFKFRIPINSSCSNSAGSGYKPSGGIFEPFSFSRGTIDYVRDSKQHITGSLPPSFSGLGDLASVRYFLKVTVRRSSMLKINFRNYEPLIFLPIDPPVDNGGKVGFVRREHILTYMGGQSINKSNTSVANNSGKSGGFFKSLFSPQPVVTSTPNSSRKGGVRFLFEVRYPLGVGLVPMEVLPLRLLVTFKEQPQINDVIYLRELNFILFATTLVASHEYSERSVISLNFFTRAQLNIPLDMKSATATPVDPSTHLPTWELPINPSVYRDAILPNSVAPSFKTCNIARSYTLQITGKFSVGNGPLEEVTLVTDVQVWSGIKPSERLAKAVLPARPTKASVTTGPSKSSSFGNEKPPPKPARPVPSSGFNQADMESSNDFPNGGGELPTYDEAVANFIEPMAGPRRTYQQSENYYTNFDSLDDRD